jgi:hypothetical protein
VAISDLACVEQQISPPRRRYQSEKTRGQPERSTQLKRIGITVASR